MSSVEHYHKDAAKEQIIEQDVPAIDETKLCGCTETTKVLDTTTTGCTDDQCEDECKPQLEFTCSICMDNVSEPVVTTCGHLSCWGCLHEWMKYKTACPVCSSGIEEENGIIPIYVAGAGSAASNPTFPPRPQGQRCAPTKRFGIRSHAEYSVSLPFLNFRFETEANYLIVAGTLLTIVPMMIMA
eukprot:m.356704 g.356704  ORF g.356704 m.356704 type:complete len:185 (-) comp17605_c0_seq1:944-1498(-)